MRINKCFLEGNGFIRFIVIFFYGLLGNGVDFNGGGGMFFVIIWYL